MKGSIAMSKIGIMGGTFNPIHTAHLILAESSYDQLKLDKILFMPSKNPPHKLHSNILSEEYRIQMVRLAIAANPHFELSMVELKREGLTYTADTLAELKKQYPENEYYFILGADSLFQIEQWWEPERIFKLSHIIAAGRDLIPNKEIVEQIDYLSNKYNGNIHFLQTPNMDISSNFIRQNRRDGRSIRYYVPDAVENYIVENHLYEKGDKINERDI